QVLEVRLRAGELRQRLDRAGPVLALAAREAEAEEDLRLERAVGRLLPARLVQGALEARAGPVVLLLAVLRLAEPGPPLRGAPALRDGGDDGGEAALRGGRVAGLQTREAGLVERAVPRGVLGAFRGDLVELDGALEVAVLEARLADEERGLGDAGVLLPDLG